MCEVSEFLYQLVVGIILDAQRLNLFSLSNFPIGVSNPQRRQFGGGMPRKCCWPQRGQTYGAPNGCIWAYLSRICFCQGVSWGMSDMSHSPSGRFTCSIGTVSTLPLLRRVSCSIFRIVSFLMASRIADWSILRGFIFGIGFIVCHQRPNRLGNRWVISGRR